MTVGIAIKAIIEKTRRLCMIFTPFTDYFERLHTRIAHRDEADCIAGDRLGGLILPLLRKGGCAPGGQQNIDPDI